MYKGIPFSPQVALADGIGAGDTTIPVTDISAFPDAPNLATIGTDEDGETILYTAKTTDSLSGCTRGVEGTAKAWPSGTTIARNFTNKDFDALQKNIQEAKKAGRSGCQRCRFCEERGSYRAEYGQCCGHCCFGRAEYGQRRGYCSKQCPDCCR